MCSPSAFCEGCCINLPAYAQAGDLSNSIFDSSTTQSSWYSQHIPVFDDIHSMRRSATDDVYESWMNSALHEQPSVLEVEQRPTNLEQQLSVGTYRPALPSLYSEDFANLWKYSSASANERLEDGDLLSPTISLPNNSVSSSAWESYNLGRLQPSSVQMEDYPSDVADSGRSPRRFSCPKCPQVSICRSEYRYCIHTLAFGVLLIVRQETYVEASRALQM
jgi:hypothetical protein